MTLGKIKTKAVPYSFIAMMFFFLAKKYNTLDARWLLFLVVVFLADIFFPRLRENYKQNMLKNKQRNINAE